MKDVKRIEIVIDTAHTPPLLKALREAGGEAYTVVRDVHGMGDRGERSGDDLTNVFQNSLIVIACPSEGESAVLKAVRPFLQRHGGMCLVSEARWLEH